MGDLFNMNKAVYGTHLEAHGQLIAELFTVNTGYSITGPFSAMGWVKNGQIAGQVIFNDYTKANIEIHIYAVGCISRKSIRELYSYVFKELKCSRITAKPYATNEKLLQLLERLGFVYECTQEAYYRENDKDIDAKVYKLMKYNIPKWVLNA